METSSPTQGLVADLAAYLSRVPFLGDTSGMRIGRLAGLTNVNYLVVSGEEQYVLRVPGVGTSEYIDRTAEEVAALAAARSGVNADVLFFDASDGLMVTRYVTGATTMSPAGFTDLGTVARAGRALHSLHTTTDVFATDFSLFEMIDEYKGLLASKNAALPDGYEELQAQAETTREALESTPRQLVPSHCDPLCENFLDTGERMFVIDYEYAGNNDAMWDLGDLSVEGRFSVQQDAVLLDAYFGGPPAAHEVGRMVAYKAMCDLLWTLWGVVQHVNGNTADDFWAYAVGRFERCRTLMSSPEYSGHLEAIRAGR